MPNIVLTRIDNRLIHGQVATQWCSSIGTNLILVSNDNVAGDKLRQGLMDMCAPAYASTRYWTLEKTISTIHKANAKQLIFIVCETPSDVLKLVEGGVPIKKVNIGNMHMAEGNHLQDLYSNKSLSKADLERRNEILRAQVINSLYCWSRRIR